MLIVSVEVQRMQDAGTLQDIHEEANLPRGGGAKPRASRREAVGSPKGL
jgi:hypothetical protein